MVVVSPNEEPDLVRPRQGRGGPELEQVHTPVPDAEGEDVPSTRDQWKKIDTQGRFSTLEGEYCRTLNTKSMIYGLESINP